MTDRLTQRFAALLGPLLLALLTACASEPAQPARPDPVALQADVADAAGGPMRIGVVLSLTSAPGEGAEWRDAAAGAQVAVRRYAMGGTKIVLDVLNDKGTSPGAVEAVKTLVQRRVAGIVVATSGPHVGPALGEASRGGIPVLLPYADQAAGLPPNVWLTGPTRQAADARLVAGLKERGVSRPFLVEAGGGPIAGLSPVGTATFRAGGDAAALAAALARRRQQPQQAFDAVVISGPAVLQAGLIQALQSARVDVPYGLTTQALTPSFPVALGEAGASPASPLLAAGLNDGDAGALEPSPAGRALSAYFSALRMTAADPAILDLLGERPFSAVAGVADVRSHDAVVVLVHTASSIASTDPAVVAAALPSRALDLGDGIAGTALDFASSTAVADQAVVALGSTTSSPGVRPVAKDEPPRLYWFAIPPP